MTKFTKFTKAAVAGLLAITMMMTTFVKGDAAEAATFSGSEFGVGFAGE